MSEHDLRDLPLESLDERHAELRLAQPRSEAAMLGSVRRFGQLSPVVAAVDDPSGAIVLLDGFKRLAAARKLGLEHLRVRVLMLNPRAAVAAVYGLNRAGRGLLDLEEAMVVRKLVRDHGLSQVEVGHLLERHKSWVCRRLALVERLADEVQGDLRVGLLRPSVARELARLPRGNQAEVAATIHRHGLSSREASRLVTLFEGASREQQSRLLEDPRASLPRTEAPHDARLGPQADRIRRRALSLHEQGARLDRLLLEEAPSWTPMERDALRPVLKRAADTALLVHHSLREALGERT